MSNLQTISKRYKIFFQCIFILVAIGVPVFWLTIKTKYDIFSLTGVSQAFDLYIHHSLSLLNRLLSLIISLIPTSVVLYMLVLLIRLFGHYEKQEIFSKKTTMLYGKLGKSLIYWFISQPI
jgi:hypothetical protein